MTIIPSNTNLLLFNIENSKQLLRLSYSERFIDLLDYQTASKQKRYKAKLCNSYNIYLSGFVLQSLALQKKSNANFHKKKLPNSFLGTEYFKSIRVSRIERLEQNAVCSAKLNALIPQSILILPLIFIDSHFSKTFTSKFSKENIASWLKTPTTFKKKDVLSLYKTERSFRLPSLREATLPATLHTKRSFVTPPVIKSGKLCFPKTKLFDFVKLETSLTQKERPFDFAYRTCPSPKVLGLLRKQGEALYVTPKMMCSSSKQRKNLKKEVPVLAPKEKKKVSAKRGSKIRYFLNPIEQNKIQKSINSIVTFLISDNFNNLKEKGYAIKQFAPALKIWSFAFGSSFFLIGVTSILQRQEQNRWFLSFSRSVFPGLYLTSEESSWECFQNITLKYLSRKSLPYLSPNAKNLVKKIDCYKDILYMGLAESWNQQAIQNYTAVFSKNSNFTLSQGSLGEEGQGKEKDESVTKFNSVPHSSPQRGISNLFFFNKKPDLKAEWIVQPWYQIYARVSPKKEITKNVKAYNQDNFSINPLPTNSSPTKKCFFKPQINRYKERVFIENDSIPSKMSSSDTSNSKRWTLASKKPGFSVFAGDFTESEKEIVNPLPLQGIKSAICKGTHSKTRSSANKASLVKALSGKNVSYPFLKKRVSAEAGVTNLLLREKPLCDSGSSAALFQRADAFSLNEVKLSNCIEKGKAKNYIDSPNDIIKNLFYESDNFCVESKAFSLRSKDIDFLPDQSLSFKDIVQPSPKAIQVSKKPDFSESGASHFSGAKANPLNFFSLLKKKNSKMGHTNPTLTSKRNTCPSLEAFEKVIYRNRFSFLQKESFFGLPSSSFRERSSQKVAPFFCKVSFDSLQAQVIGDSPIYEKNPQIDIDLEQKDHLSKSRSFWHGSHISAQSPTNSYRHFKESALKKGEKLSSYFLFKRKTVSNRFMSGYQQPETTLLRIKGGKKKSICGGNSGIEFSIKVSPALPFYESVLKSLRHAFNQALAEPITFLQKKVLYEGHKNQASKEPSYRGSRASSLTKSNNFLFTGGEIPCESHFFSPEVLQSDALYVALREAKLPATEESKQGKALYVTTNQRVKGEKKDKLVSRIKSIIKLKKMPYKELSLNEKGEVEPLFEQVNKTFYVSPYRFTFKKSLFADYNDYLNWPKDNPVAISISPFIEATVDEEKRAVKDSWVSSSPEVKTGFPFAPSTSGDRKWESELPQKPGGTPPLEGGLRARGSDSFYNRNANMKKANPESPDDKNLPLKEQELRSSKKLSQKKEKERWSLVDKDVKQSESQKNPASESPAGLSTRDLKDILPVESSNIGEEEDKKREITKSEWLEQIRESEQYLEKRKDLQKLAYPQKKALANRSLQKSPGKIHSLLVSDRKASFFGITNLFPKRLISEDQKQIAFKILRENRNQKSVSLLEKLNQKYGENSLSFPEEVGLFDTMREEAFSHSDEVEITQNKIDEPITFDARPEKQLQNGVKIQRKQSGSKTSHVPGQLKDLLVPYEPFTESEELASQTRRRLALNIKGDLLTSEGDGVPMKLCNCTCKPLSFKKKTTRIITRQHPIYTPNRRLRLRVPQPSLASQNSNNQSRIEDLNLSSEHRWWQKRRISSSLLGAPSKRYLVMPEISTQDWRKIIEWQLKIYFLEEEKRLLQMQTEEKVSSEKKAFQREAFSGNIEKMFVTQAPDIKQLFTIKKLAIYLPWTSLKKSLKKPFEWPITLLSYSSSLHPQKSGFFSGSNHFLQGEKNKDSTPKELFCSKKTFFSDKLNTPLCKVLKRGFEKGRTIEKPRKDRAKLSQKDFGSQTDFALISKFCAAKAWPYKSSICTCFGSLRLAKNGLPVAHKAKQEKSLTQNFIKNKKTDSCFVSSISPPFKSAPFFAYKSGLLNSLCFCKNSQRLFFTKNVSATDKAKVYKTESDGFAFSGFTKQSHISKPFLFEAQTQSSYLLLHGLFLVIGLKRFLGGLYKVFGTLILSKIKNSSLSVLLLPLFFNAFGSSNSPYSFDSLQTRAKHLADSEDTISSLSEIVWYLRNSCRGRLVPRGVVLVEKFSSESTNFLKAIGGEAQVPVIVQSLRALPYTQNHPQRQLEKILTFAQKRSPCILFLDDLDSIGQSRTLLLKNDEKPCKSEICINTFKSWRQKTQQHEKYWVRNFPPLSKGFTTHLPQSKLLKGPILFGEGVQSEAFFDEEKAFFAKKASGCKSSYCSFPKRDYNASYKYKSSICKKICTCKGGGEKRKWKRYKNTLDKPFTAVTKTIDPSRLGNANSCKASYSQNRFLDKGKCTNGSSYSRLPIEDLYDNISTDSEKASYKSKICRPKYDDPLKKRSELEKTTITPFDAHPETEKVVEQRRVDLMLRLLTVMDGISGLNGVLIMTTSKNPSLLDPALLRPGRFEKLIHLKLPTKKKRILLLKRESAKLGHTNPMPWDFFGRQTQEMTGSDIASAVNHSAFRSIMKSTVHTFPTLEYGINRVTRSSKAPIYKSICTKDKQTMSGEISSQISFYSAGKGIVRALTLGSSFYLGRSQKKYLIRTDFAKETIRLYAGQAALALYLDSVSCFENKWSSNTFFCTQKRPLALQSTYSYKEGFRASSIIKNMTDHFCFYPKTKEKLLKTTANRRFTSKVTNRKFVCADQSNKNSLEGDPFLDIDLSYYNMVLSCFYVAFQNCAENRELLDFVTDHLIRFKVLKLHEILRIVLFYY